MKPIRWVCCSGWLLLVALSLGAAQEPVRPRQAAVLLSTALEPPAPAAGWAAIALPYSGAQPAAWFRVDFEAGAAPADSWAVYLPYLNGGGRLVLNGVPLAHVQEPSPALVVRWERPHLVAIPPPLLRPGANQLLIRVAASPSSRIIRVPLLEVGPVLQLLPAYERRLFWVRSMAQFTVISCLIVGTLSLFIWWRRREEALYGLFGAAALLWGVRTLTFVVEVLPATSWLMWRTAYHAATGGFAIVMLLFTMSLAGMGYPRLRRILLGYWMLGPLGYLVSGGNEAMIGRYWTAGLLPIGCAVLAISAVAAWRQRTAALVALSLALSVAVLAGFHDYLLASAAPLMQLLAPQVAANRIFLLHYAADLVLVVMGGTLSARLVSAFQAIEQLNRTLESRVREREAALAANYERMRHLERQHAAGEERQQIMRDLHDGLGSQLFITLSRAEMGRIDQAEIVQALRACIADMRLTLEAMSPENNDFLEAWGNFRFRWQQLLDASGLASSWQTEAEGEPVELAPHVSLQLLRIVQEALTNILKHAAARTVAVRLHTDARVIVIEVSDDGHGMHRTGAVAGRGMVNMRARALRVGARLEITHLEPGLRVAVDLDRRTAAPVA